MTASHVFEVTAATFEADVVVRSRTTPVLLDFWADWCGPCKTLTPILEKLATDFAGGFLLGKVNTEVEQELSYAFQVQSIPFCVLLEGGRPVDGFAGALPENQVREFLERNGVGAAAAAPAEDAPDPEAPEARFAAGLAAILRADAGAARERLAGIPEDHAKRADVERLLEGLDVFGSDVDGLAGEPGERLRSGRDELVQGRIDAAVESWLESVAADKAALGGLARRAVLLGLVILSEDEQRTEQVVDFRRRLGTLLF